MSNEHIYSDEDVVQQGEALYERRIRPEIDERDRGKFVVVDIETGDYLLDADELQALKTCQVEEPEQLPESLFREYNKQ